MSRFIFAVNAFCKLRKLLPVFLQRPECMLHAPETPGSSVHLQSPLLSVGLYFSVNYFLSPEISCGFGSAIHSLPRFPAFVKHLGDSFINLS
jgi:hypothetical protein